LNSSKNERGSSRGAATIGWKLVGLVLCGSTLISLAVLYDRRVREEWSALPASDGRTVDAVHARLSALEGFLDRNPMWLGTHDALKERTELRTRLEILRTEQVLAETERLQAEELGADAAESARLRGGELAVAGDLEAALDELEAALELAPEDWESRERVIRDVEAIEAALEGNE